MESSEEHSRGLGQEAPELSNKSVDVRPDKGMLPSGCLSSIANNRAIPSELLENLPFPWIAVCDEHALHVLLLSRVQEKCVQRRASFYFNGVEEISIHMKALGGAPLQDILRREDENEGNDLNLHICSPVAQRVLTVVKRLMSYEVCVGVNDHKYRPLWEIDKGGEIDKNLFGELRYCGDTFRPYKCHLLVSTARYMRHRCSVCIKTVDRFRVRLKRHSSDGARSNTPNMHLDRSQLLSKVSMQQKKLRSCSVKVARLKKELEGALLNMKGDITKVNSDELLKICLAFTTSGE